MILRALGGAPLLGANLTRFVYLDEAGISGKQEPWLVVGGVLVDGDTQLDDLYREIEVVSERHLPQDYRDEDIILHAGDLYGGNGHFDEGRDPYWTMEKRHAVLADLAKIPDKTDILIAGAPMDMSQFDSDIYIPISERDEHKRSR